MPTAATMNGRLDLSQERLSFLDDPLVESRAGACDEVSCLCEGRPRFVGAPPTGKESDIADHRLGSLEPVVTADESIEYPMPDRVSLIVLALGRAQLGLITVAIHRKDLKRATLHSIIKQAGLSVEEF